MHAARRRLKLSPPPLARLLLLLLASLGARAEQLPIKTYTAADGLAQDRVKRIVRDTRGFLWFCTADGLSRFDGYRFTTYDAGRGLPYASINDLLEARGGVYWVATNGGGVFRFNPAARADTTTHTRADSGAPLFSNYTVGDDPLTNRVNRLYEDAAGRIWAGTDKGLFVLDERAGPQGFRPFAWTAPELAGRTVQVWSFVEDGASNLWIGTSSGLVRSAPDGRMRRYLILPGRRGSVFDLLRDRDGRLWAAHSTGLLIFNPESGEAVTAGAAAPWRVLRRTAADARQGRIVLPAARGEAYSYTRADGLAHDIVLALFQASDGRVWLGTWAGLAVFDGTHFRNLTAAQGVREDICNALAEDRDGNLWAGSSTSGALKIARNGLITYRTADGLSDPLIHKIFQDRAGALCVLARRMFLDRFDGRKFNAIHPRLPDKAKTIYDVLQDHTGEWWLATGRGLYRFPSGDIAQLARTRPRAYTAADGLTSEAAYRLFEDTRGDIWIGTGGRDPLTRWERATEKFHRYGAADGLPEQGRINSFAEDGAGGVWVGFRDHGLARHAAGRFMLLTERDGLPSREVPTIYRDRAGRLWAAVTAQGLVRVDEPSSEHPRLRLYTTFDGLTSNLIPTIAEDNRGRIYVGTTRSVDRLDPASGRIRHYGVADGLASSEVISSYLDRQGTLWFGTHNGLSRLVPEAESPAPRPPPILIGGLSVAGQPQALSDIGETQLAGLRFEHTQNQVRVDFFSLGFAPGEVLRYQYKLEGSGDRDWGAPTEQRNVNYANLAPGTYRFLVRAVNADGVVSAQPASVSFTILPPVWRRWWFLTVAALAAAAVVHLGYRYRTARLLELERVRTRIATDLHDDIGSSLSQIAILSEVAGRRLAAPDRAPAAEPLAQIASTSREMVDAMSDIVWAINPQRDHLSDLAHRMRRFASDTLGARDISFRFHAPAEDERNLRLGTDLRREVYLIFKECVNNVVKHAHCTEAAVEFHIAGGWLTLTVSDNGRGFDPATGGAGGDGRNGGQGGHGLLSMRRRAAALGGTFEVQSGPERGTSAKLKVPVGRHPRRWA